MKFTLKTGTKIGIAAMLLAVATAWYWFYLTRQVSLPDDRTLFVVVFLSAAGLGVLAYFKGTSILGGFPPAVAIVIGLFLPFTMLISPQTVDSGRAISVGDTIPSFTALDASGELFDSRSLNGHLLLIKFFRANW